MEVTVVMVLTALVFVTCYTALHLLGTSFLSFGRKNGERSELFLTQRLLRRDFMRARTITRSAGGIALAMENGRVDYFVDGPYLVRDQDGVRRDTLKLPISDPSITFETRLAEVGTTVDDFRLRVRLEGKNFVLACHKPYSSEEFLSITP